MANSTRELVERSHIALGVAQSQRKLYRVLSFDAHSVVPCFVVCKLRNTCALALQVALCIIRSVCQVVTTAAMTISATAAKEFARSEVSNVIGALTSADGSVAGLAGAASPTAAVILAAATLSSTFGRQPRG